MVENHSNGRKVCSFNLKYPGLPICTKYPTCLESSNQLSNPSHQHHHLILHHNCNHSITSVSINKHFSYSYIPIQTKPSETVTLKEWEVKIIFMSIWFPHFSHWQSSELKFSVINLKGIDRLDCGCWDKGLERWIVSYGYEL